MLLLVGEKEGPGKLESVHTWTWVAIYSNEFLKTRIFFLCRGMWHRYLWIREAINIWSWVASKFFSNSVILRSMKFVLLIYIVVKFPHFYLTKAIVCLVQFSRSVVSDSLWPHRLQHARPACPSPTPRVYSNSCPLSQWCHSTISSSVIAFSSHLQSFPASGSFKWVSSLHQVDKVLEFQLQHQSFQWIFRTDFLSDGLVGSPCSPRDS